MRASRAIGALLLAVAAAGCSRPAPESASTPAAQGTGAQSTGAKGAGERIYTSNCIACHQLGGQGIPGVYPSLAGSALVTGEPRVLARWIIKGERPATMPAGRYAAMMPQYAWLKDADAAALLSYLRSSFGNAAPAVDAATIQQALQP